MKESQLFKTTCVVLAATLLVPLVVAMTGLGGGNNPSDYIAEGTASTLGQTDDKSNDKNEPKDHQNDAKKPGDKKTPTDTKKDEKASETTTSSATVGAMPASTYTVKAGDTYGCIAENYYGSYEQWPLVYGANAGGDGYGEYRLAIGAEVILPAITAAQVTPASNLCD